MQVTHNTHTKVAFFRGGETAIILYTFPCGLTGKEYRGRRQNTDTQREATTQCIQVRTSYYVSHIFLYKAKLTFEEKATTAH